ncbi:MAG: DUF2007 domain-containing protein [Candidatus Aminicenantes bacterium]|nr:DUF2007 domain-containing protein [Candidatus Aminicenantes bacterium]HHF52165.1 DUF2007 domain-containing protein [Candidatus Aminicenantes bacterium]
MKDKRDKKPRDIKLIEVTTVQGPVEAEVIKSFLESCGITAFLKGLVVQSVHAFSADGLGKIRIMVDEKDYQKAKSLLKEKNP